MTNFNQPHQLNNDKIPLEGVFHTWIGDDCSTWNKVMGKFRNGSLNTNGELILTLCTVWPCFYEYLFQYARKVILLLAVLLVKMMAPSRLWHHSLQWGMLTLPRLWEAQNAVWSTILSILSWISGFILLDRSFLKNWTNVLMFWNFAWKRGEPS